MAVTESWATGDTSAIRKARGAFFTPERIARFIAAWALLRPNQRVLEPSAGDAAFLVEAVARLAELGGVQPLVDGIEIHEHSATVGARRIEAAGGTPRMRVSDFFLVEPDGSYDAVIGNPPYVRYQDWTGEARTRSRSAALAAGVALSGLASSWAAFTVQSAMFLRKGGRLGLVLPAELLSVNYAAPVRKFLFDRFRHVELVLFAKQVFEEAEADTLLLLAEGFGLGPTDHAVIRQVTDADHLGAEVAGVKWTPSDPAGKWMAGSDARSALAKLSSAGHLSPLLEWGDTTLGMVTGSNHYFALSPARVAELGLSRSDVISLSPPGSSHLRGLSLTTKAMTRLGQSGSATRLFRPSGVPSEAAQTYIDAGETAGVSDAYKCRVRSTWWRVPFLKPADLLLTYMNADVVRIVTNEAGAHHVNSVHGVYLYERHRRLGRSALPLASLNSATILSGELTGRSYGGGILKMEPREADQWLMPSPQLVAEREQELMKFRPSVLRRLQKGDLRGAAALVDSVILRDLVSATEVAEMRKAHAELQSRRVTRSKRGQG